MPFILLGLGLPPLSQLGVKRRFRHLRSYSIHRVEVRVRAIVISRDTVSWCNGQLKAGRLRTGQRKTGGWLGFMEKAAQKAAFHSLLYKFRLRV